MSIKNPKNIPIIALNHIKELTSMEDVELENHRIFGTDEKEIEIEKKGLRFVDASNLFTYKNHPFKLYTGERYDDMLESIRKNGILNPVIVRPLHEDNIVAKCTYEILSGHNRVNIAKKLGIKRIPVIIKYNLSEEEALVYVIETNVMQRSFSDLSHSEKAFVLKNQYELIFSQGKRNDIINELKNLENKGHFSFNTAEKEQKLRSANICYFPEKTTLPLIGTKLRTDEKIAEKYNLSKNTVARYIRIAKLIKPLLDRMDAEEIPLYAGVELSYLNTEEQEHIEKILAETDLKVTMKTAKQLRSYSSYKELSQPEVKNIISGLYEKDKKDNTKMSLTLKHGTLKKYYGVNTSVEDIEKDIIELLELKKNIISDLKKKLAFGNNDEIQALKKFVKALAERTRPRE